MEIEGRLTAEGPEFAPELIVELLNDWARVVEVPINYFPRIGGTSKFSGSFFRLAITATRMAILILNRRLSSWYTNLIFVIGIKNTKQLNL